MVSTVETMVHALASAHRSGRVANAADLAALDVSIGEAYAVQAGTAIALAEGVGGWKAGFGPDGEPVAAPMLASTVEAHGARIALPPDRSVLLEIEIAFRLARDLPPRPERPYTRGEIEDAIDVALAGAEILAPRGGMPASGTPFPRFVADLQGNAGYVCGGETRGFPSLDLSARRVRLWIDDALVHDAVGGHPQGDPWAPVVAWARAQRDRLGGMKRGQVITTGSLNKPLTVEAPCRVRAEVEGVGEVAFEFVAPAR
ncbi:MAG TPA: hypothetical protein PLM09_08690 [Casimicrobiaceae bacterium]|nr:hypothetical protein [Casimicrobiaceae bacterium]